MWFGKETMKENKQRRRFTDISSRDGKPHQGPSQTDREEEAMKPKCERKHKFNRSEAIKSAIKVSEKGSEQCNCSTLVKIVHGKEYLGPVPSTFSGKTCEPTEFARLL